MIGGAAKTQPAHDSSHLWLPQRSFLAETAVASPGQDGRPLRAAVVLRAGAEALRENRKAGRREGSAGGAGSWRASWREAREPPISHFPPSRLPAFLLFPARSCEVAQNRHGSFCDSGCSAVPIAEAAGAAIGAGGRERRVQGGWVEVPSA